MKMTTAIGLTLAGVIGVSAVLLRSWPLINIVETGRTPEYPDVTPHLYPATVAQAFDAALHAVSQLPRWSLVIYAEDKGEIHAEARTSVLQFVDDVVIRIREQDHTAVVNVRSASRVGQGDFGQNARNIRAFFEELDRRMRERSAH